ncbi:L-seryl-tRNA(Sec) selenium transferase [Desulfofustis glycolicus]|uniref:L-seryl-tRNA(Sec) selenium transferase n=1 Tax=Desulfofustis glycolicus DSM 9705 TaxID=1121409 RepID=A0A1M5Y3E8_9BACT|nr:L-seryl-tRNA(Sec) selenium transferase [Desulfofustis glycolicus]MCB2214881.1 L-seryl-tRNA(Sec) selenium transferase [Desulfobulbaceae bacterium]SHI06600.1 L-seryl-tRNA(Sec) selenium transferase [Desulfofustis glycolicus DSM 9705]
MDQKAEMLRNLPKVDECLLELSDFINQQGVPLRIAKKAVQTTIDRVRKGILAGGDITLPVDRSAWKSLFVDQIGQLQRSRFRRVINGTGVVIHTNLGRSLLSTAALEQLIAGAGYYSNLEFDLHSGKRGSRYALVEDIICDLAGAEAALVVNNNAAAVLIALDTIARGREVIVSRGELVEIGGSFRIPDVMAKSGAELVEVGATNRTHLYDYERAITERTGLLLRVHTSNFRMIGFTAAVPAQELVALGRTKGLPVMEDLGSGSLIDLERFGLPAEPTVQEVLAAGVDLVTFSGDKLLGGPQAGVIVGRKDLVDQIKRNPLNRALRIDKFTLASLEGTLRAYYDESLACKQIPTLRMIGESQSTIKKRASRLLRRIGKKSPDGCLFSLVPTVSRVGGGALPEYGLDSWAVQLQPVDVPVSTLERDFRRLQIPLIGRVEHDRFHIDMRTIQDSEIALLADQLVEYFSLVC